MSDRVAAQTQQTADVGRRLEMHAHEMTSRMTFASAKKGALRSVQRAAAKAPRSWRSVDRHGLPVAVHVASASPYEPHLVPATLDARFFPDLPTRLIGDRGYDSDRLDDTLMTTYGIEMIARAPAWPCAHAGWPTAASRPPPLEDRALLRLAPQLAPS